MTLVIAEAGVNHNGDIKLAKELIDAAKYAGADIVKFQTFKTELEVRSNTPVADYQKINAPKINNQFDLLKSLELSFDDFQELNDYASQLNLEFLSSAFDLESFSLLKKLNLKRCKIASGEINNFPFLREVSKANLPIILSSGMSSLSDIEFAINTLIKFGSKKQDITVLHCVSEYPAPKESVNLNAMQTIANAFHINTGFSDHTEGIEVAIYASLLGASIIEKHLTLDKNLIGPDHSASIEPEEFKKMTSLIKEAKRIKGDGSKVPSEYEIKNLDIVRKSVVAKKPIMKGELLSENNLTVKRPGSGISPKYWEKIIGRLSSKDYSKDDFIEW